MNIPTSHEVGQALLKGARCLALSVAVVYAAGLTLGLWVHATNDRLASAYVTMLGLTPNAPAVVKAAPKARRVVAVVVKRPPTADQLLTKTNAQLRELAGTKSRKSKKQLVEMILAKN